MFYTISTAGHIDHGKSSLVKALTGINPDRLPEEQAREMTIDLGFAWLTLADGSEVGIVDVPGHERFIRNMIAGVGGIDYVLFIVAADDGWMPQSQEHLEILNFLDQKEGAVILTKIDLAKPDWVELVCEDLKGQLKRTFLEKAPILKFSAQTGEGLEEIKAHLSEALPKLPPRYNPQKPRLFIDRVFSMAGIGTIATGTMRDGEFALGDEVAIIPTGKTAKIKSIQTFKQQRDRAFQGARAAFSLTGVSREEISRGNCLVAPSDWRGTRQIALRVKLSPEIRIPVTHNRAVNILLGTTEVEARVRLFSDEKINPGGEGVALLSFDEHISARFGDRVILRYPTPDLLLGGGTVTDVDLIPFIRRDKDLRKFYFERSTNNISELIFSELRKYKTRSLSNLLEAANFSALDIRNAISDLIRQKQIEQYGNLLIGTDYKNRLLEKIEGYLEAFHHNHPTRAGVSKSELISKLQVEPVAIDFALEHLQKTGKLEARDKLIFKSGHKTSLKPEQEKIRQDILTQLAVPDLQTPSRREVEKNMHVVKEVLNYLIQIREVIELSEGVLFRAEDYQKIVKAITDLIRQNGFLEVKDIKDTLGLTRKYTIPILERLDQDGVTRREGDRRVLNE